MFDFVCVGQQSGRYFFFFQAEDGIRDADVTGVQTCALLIYGRRPRILVAKLGQDGHDRGAKVIASSFADIGFDVDMGSLFQEPASVVRQAIENDVHFLGISSLAGAHETLVPEVIEKLVKEEVDDIKVIVGGVIPGSDYDRLYKAGVYRIFGPGTNIAEAAADILQESLSMISSTSE